MRLTTLTEATAAVPREPIDDGLVDVGDRDLGQRQPMREVASCTVISPHCQDSAPRLRQMARELCHPWGKIVRMHAPPPGAAILIRLSHPMLPSPCHQDSEGRPELCGVGKRAHGPKLLITGKVSKSGDGALCITVGSA